MCEEDANDAVYSSVLSEYYNKLDNEGIVAANEYLQMQYALHPKCASLSFCMGVIKCKWDESYFIYNATEEACTYFENAYSIDSVSPDSIWGQGLVAYRNKDYNKAISFMTDFLLHISISSEEGSLSINPSTGIISCLDQYSTAAFIILDCCAHGDSSDDSVPLSILMTRTHLILDPSYFNPKTLRRGMQVLYYSVQYAKQAKDPALVYQYAKDYICIYNIIEREWRLNGSTSTIDNQDEMVNYLNEMLAISYYCLDILESYYFEYTEF